MATTSTRWGFTLPDPADTVDITQLNNDLLKVDTGLGVTPCTSSTRPSSPVDGQIIREHDTGAVSIWDATSNAWAAVSSSNTTTSGSGGIPLSTFAAKGDLLVATANDAVARLGVGTNGQVLTADLTQAAGIKWGTPSSGTGSGSSLVLNVKDGAFGAAGNGVADDTAAIQAAIDAAFAAGGGRVYLPAGTYKITAALVIKRRVILIGDGIAAGQANVATIIFQSSTTAHAITAVDQKDISIEDLTLVGPGSGTGNGLSFTRSVNPDISGITLRRVQISSFGGMGMDISNPITSTFDRVLCDSMPVGFYLHGVTGAGGSAGTSVTFLNCYAAGCTQSGFRLDNMTYCAFVGCASDACGIAYELIESGTQGIAFVGCGCESMVSGGTSYPGIGWKINGCIGVSLDGGYTFNSPNTSIWVTGNATAVNITGFSENTPQAGVTNCIKVDAGCNVTVSDVDYTHPISGSVLLVNDGGGLSVPGYLFIGGTAEITGAATLDTTLKLANQGSVPATPTGGGVLYVQSGALKYKGSSGTVTNVGNA